ncbi:3-hydroxy-5-phosphonooxypentane-2,4-dione thiolase [Microbacterium resistens]|uniref:3-hydroxy-5-phosphonooxypentane-2,4-dione thiolase n=1 Tax=Microbacterium resistens TaxID=156977 RepID=A0ABY3RSX5_9MICO|nr:3-hydroxy-5-phosphonooxypentane-2,4-dione thiolase [Microbacterium resistens]UGS26026.1 3-hydroxy-5-phosphonooxypentane-2,4-dione thiolase [Microbacterium resistens]
MADLEGNRSAKQFHADVPAVRFTNAIKGAHALDWGMQNRLSRILDPETGRTVMLAFDHGYFQGPTSGLERIDLGIAPLATQADALMGTRGAFRTSIPAGTSAGLVVRASGGPSILKDLSDEHVALAMDDAVRLNASAVAVQVFVGGEHESRSIRNLTTLVDDGYRAGIPVLGVTAVGKELTRDARYLGLAVRIIAELGAQMVKTYYCEDGFEDVVAACPVPVIMAGGKKLSELDALRMASAAVRAGAAGVDMGRNIFQSEAPEAMIAAVHAVVHGDLDPVDAHELYRERAQGGASA